MSLSINKSPTFNTISIADSKLSRAWPVTRIMYMIIRELRERERKREKGDARIYRIKKERKIYSGEDSSEEFACSPLANIPRLRISFKIQLSSSRKKSHRRRRLSSLDGPWIQTAAAADGTRHGLRPRWVKVKLITASTPPACVLQEPTLAKNDAIHIGRANTGPLNRNTNRSASALLEYLPSSNLIAICKRN